MTHAAHTTGWRTTSTRLTCVLACCAVGLPNFSCSNDQHPQAPAAPPPVRTAAILPGSEEGTSATGQPFAATVSAEQAQAIADFQILTTQGVSGDTWDNAQQRLICSGKTAVPVLRQQLLNADPMAREMAATILALIGRDAEPAADVLKLALADPSQFVRANAATALCQIPGYANDVMPVLADLLAASDPQLRRLAATNLGYFGTDAEPYVPKLTLALDDSEAEVVRPVMQLLGRIGPAARTALPRLQQIAFEHDAEMAQVANQAIAEIESPATAPAPTNP